MIKINSCRICLGSEQDKLNELIKPCRCRSMFQYVHKKCIETWLEITSNEFCEICKFKFLQKKKCKNFIQYLNIEHEEFIDIIIVILFTSFTSYILSIGFILSYISFKTVSKSIGQFIFIISTIFSCLLIFFLILFIRRVLRLFLSWRLTHFNVTIKQPKSENKI